MLITDATVVTWGDQPRILQDYALYIENGVIQAVGPAEVLLPNYRDARPLSARGQLVMPGNICAHTHFYGAYARGMAIPGPAPIDFPDILKRLWWTLDKALDKDAVYLSALVCLIDAIKHGTTTVIDHHASPNFIDGSLDVIAEAVERAGLRAVLCYEVTDRDGKEKAEAGIAENVRFLNKQKQHPLVRGAFGLHASLSLNDETLQACVDAVSSDTGFHIHVAEHEADQNDSQQKYGKSVVRRLNEFGILRSNSIAAHCVHIDNVEMDILRNTQTWVTHQPRSNMNNAVGAMPLEKMVERGVRLGLGNDGFSNNMWAEWKAAYFLHKVTHRDPRQANGKLIADIAVQNNGKLVQAFSPELRFSELTEGAAADIIFVDYKPFTPITPDNLPWHILFGFEASMVTTTIVAGNVLMVDRQLVTLNEEAIVNEALALAPSIWERFNKLSTH